MAKILVMPQRQRCEYLVLISVHKRARNWIYASMQILNCSLRGIAEVSGYRGDAEFETFYRRLSRNKKLKTDSPAFIEQKKRIEIAIIKRWKQDIEDQKNDDCIKMIHNNLSG